MKGDVYVMRTNPLHDTDARMKKGQDCESTPGGKFQIESEGIKYVCFATVLKSNKFVRD